MLFSWHLIVWFLIIIDHDVAKQLLHCYCILMTYRKLSIFPMTKQTHTCFWVSVPKYVYSICVCVGSGRTVVCRTWESTTDHRYQFRELRQRVAVSKLNTLTWTKVSAVTSLESSTSGILRLFVFSRTKQTTHIEPIQYCSIKGLYIKPL